MSRLEFILTKNVAARVKNKRRQPLLKKKPSRMITIYNFVEVVEHFTAGFTWNYNRKFNQYCTC